MTPASIKNFLKVSDLNQNSLLQFLNLAVNIKNNPGKYSDALTGRSIVSIYEKPSTRTRVSTAVAAYRLGMNHMELSTGRSQMARGESLADTAKTLSGYVDLISFRTHEHSRVEELALHSAVPVINALTNVHHPCQALADMLTLHEVFGTVGGLNVAFIGDASGNIGRSFLEAAALSQINVRVGSPKEYWPNHEFLSELNRLCAVSGSVVEWLADPREAARGAAVVYPEVWVPMDQEECRAERIGALRSYWVDEDLMTLCAPGAIFMHCLPAQRGQEVSSEVIDGPRSVVWQQAANRVPVCQAVMLELCSLSGYGE